MRTSFLLLIILLVLLDIHGNVSAMRDKLAPRPPAIQTETH